MRQNKKIKASLACQGCLRPKQHCICSSVKQWNNSIFVCILQHPQERLKLLNSAKLVSLILKNSVLKVGLSWPNVRIATGFDYRHGEWGVLFLKGQHQSGSLMEIFDRRGQLVTTRPAFKGIIVVDGSWKQAKTLWWRNPWINKLFRISLNPTHPSLREQVRKEGLSTIEAVALALREFGEGEELYELLIKQYREYIIGPFLDKAQEEYAS